jgi:hypothetical protein
MPAAGEGEAGLKTQLEGWRGELEGEVEVKRKKKFRSLNGSLEKNSSKPTFLLCQK